jgi:hypothetical protein
VQLLHCRPDIAGNDARQYPDCIIDSTVNGGTFLAGCGIQDITHDIVTVTGVPDTDPQSQEVTAAQMRNQVTQTIVSAVATALLQPDCSRRQVQVIVYNKDAAARDLVERSQRCDRQAAAVHEIHRLLQPAVMARDAAASKLAFEFTLDLEYRTAASGNLVHKPEPGVMPGLFVLFAGVTQTGD